MAKRGNGEGSVSRRRDGRWEGRISYLDLTGARQRKVLYGQTRREVSAKLTEVRQRLDAGEPVADSSMSLGAWLDLWLATAVAASDRKASTKDLYAKMVRVHLKPTIGAVPLAKLRPTDVEAMLLGLRQAGKSGATRRTVYNVLRAALEVAVRDGLLRTNPATRIARPAAHTPEARTLTAEQVGRIIQASGRERLGALVVVLVFTGMRIGEALALRWDDVDLDAGTLRVTGTLYRIKGELVRTPPKSARSRRTLPLVPPVVDALRAHRTTQLGERLGAGRAWRDEGYVFATEIGTPLDHSNVLRWYRRLATTVDVPGGFHVLRHSAATALMTSGAPVRVVADILGHSSTRLTTDTYQHVTEALARDALNRLAQVFGS
ncbi:MAG TPA: tyrosine-type recombinase/integrase [Mycobacteriales bacterium]|jgi:integrase|nr:tyrosine-type recombinase/integrase [Mycobacteriales bacterium]